MSLIAFLERKRTLMLIFLITQLDTACNSM